MRISFHGAANLRAFIYPVLSLRTRFHVLPSSTGLLSGFPPSRKRRARRAPRCAVPGKACSRGVLKDKVSALTGAFAAQLRDTLPPGIGDMVPQKSSADYAKQGNALQNGGTNTIITAYSPRPGIRFKRFFISPNLHALAGTTEHESTLGDGIGEKIYSF